MKIYVDGDLPKNCLDCPCFNGIDNDCNLDKNFKGYFKDENEYGYCPLTTVKTLKKRWAKKMSMAKNNNANKTNKD